MIKFLSFILVLSILGGASFVGLSIYQKQHNQRLIPVELILEKIESSINDGTLPASISVLLSNFMDERAARCQMVAPKREQTEIKIKPIPDERFFFGRVINLKETGALCVAPGFGESVLFQAPWAPGSVTIRRKPDSPLMFSVEAGKLNLSSNRLYIEWKAPGMKLELKSKASVVMTLSHQGSDIIATVFTGNLNVELLKTGVRSEISLPIVFKTEANAIVSSGAKQVASNGGQATLLPSGFTPSSPKPAP